MQYSPKLKKVMEEIRKLLLKNDVAAFVVLHDERGFSEYLNAVATSYSCAFVEGDTIRFRLRAAEVGKEKAQALAEGTFNMITHMADVIGMHAMTYIDAQKQLKEKWGGEEFGGDHTSHTQQNN